MKPDTEQIIHNLKAWIPLSSPLDKILNQAADRLEELQRQNDLTQHDQMLWKREQEAHVECRGDLALMIAERDGARAEVGRLTQALHDARIENSGQAAQLERTRPEPSRLEIAAQFMVGSFLGAGEKITNKQAFKMADALILAAKEGK
jgi:hypothetical protein